MVDGWIGIDYDDERGRMKREKGPLGWWG